MKKYEVKLPVAGHILVEVHGESEFDAIKNALDAELKREMITGWDVFETLHSGFRLHAPCHVATAKEI